MLVIFQRYYSIGFLLIPSRDRGAVCLAFNQLLYQPVGVAFLLVPNPLRFANASFLLIIMSSCLFTLLSLYTGFSGDRQQIRLPYTDKKIFGFSGYRPLLVPLPPPLPVQEPVIFSPISTPFFGYFLTISNRRLTPFILVP